MLATLAAAALSAASASPEPGQHHDHGLQLGAVAFETSCTAPADALFGQALAWLHSFEYEQAEKTFAEAAAVDPRCAIAHWGEAMSLYHPLWVPPSPAELAKGAKALAAARAAGSGSAREAAYIAALETFYGDAARLDHKTRALAYAAAMERLHARYPDDREAAVFYALALIAAGTMDADPAFAAERKAGAILNRVLAEAPDHPGVAHYLIHSFDYPALADLALPAARRYASIAPASPHAQHMPSHIFVRLGLWDEAIASNIDSEASARVMAKSQGLADSSSERLHAMDYLVYAYLQTGQDAKAEAVWTDLKAIRRADPPIFSVAYAATAVPARLLLERRQWAAAAALELPRTVRGLAPLETFKWGEAHVRFARAVGAARSGQVAAAQAEIAALSALEQELVIPPGTYDWRAPVAVERRIAEAWLAAAQGRNDAALAAMEAAAELDDTTEKHPVTPGAILPAREQLGELLFALSRPEDALRAYQTSLARAPRRLAGLAGAGRAALAAGRRAEARDFYARLLAQTRQGDAARPELAEARAALETLAAR